METNTNKNREQLVNDVSAARIARTLARAAVDTAGWSAPAATLREWHKYLVARRDEAAAEDELFAHDLQVALAELGRVRK